MLTPAELENETIQIPQQEDSGILVVDDDEFVVNLILRVLRTGGYENIITANNGREALSLLGLSSDGRRIENTPPCPVGLVISDIVMPDISGVDVCRQIKLARPDTGVILVTGHDIKGIQEHLLQSGADDFLTKPFNPLELITRVNLIMQRWQQQQRVRSVRESGRTESPHRMPYVGDHIGEYVIIDTLGWGKSSIVFKAVEASRKRVVAIKMLTVYAAEFSELNRRFRNEAKIMAGIQHPNIIAIMHSGEFNACPYIVLEYFSGIDLEEYVATRGRTPFKAFYNIAECLADAVRLIHDAGIVHRDIKLKNILYDPRSNVMKLSDFGIALDEDSPHVTQDGFIVGTPYYMAPEVLSGEAANRQSDIYAYGATMYHLLTGSPPFVAEHAKDIYQMHQHEPVPPINSHRLGIPHGWQELIVEKCLAKSPAARPKDMAEVLSSVRKLKHDSF